ncbi:MAG TPA: non-homologous end-joining DNA ligase [Acidimicrobiales bacterium]
MAKGDTRVSIAGRELNVSNLDKVLFPETGFTKGQLIEYYVTVGPIMLGHIADRPLTMKRYPDGVAKKFFFEKHVPSHAPEWVRSVSVPASDGAPGVSYPVIDDVAALAWVANLAAIELHVPLWRIGRRRALPAAPDLIVFDLDPGEGTSIVECCTVAGHIAQVLTDRGYEGYAKTSGSKGLQVYARLQGRPTWEKSRGESHEIARALEQEFPEQVTSNMRKSLREGRVLIDWSQNHPSKTTVAVYSVRGLARPTVSTPVTWAEVRACAKKKDPTLLEFTADRVLERVKKMGDLFEPLAPTPASTKKTTAFAEPALREYRAKRNAAVTPEPMGSEATTARQGLPMFVVQEHHARALHWDFRLEHDGVLASWALPKGVPLDPKTNHLAVRTEDHPLSYASFAGDIPAGEYGGGHVTIWDHGTYELEKWRPKEVMVVLHGERVSGRYVLFPTQGRNWMIHRMDPAPSDFAPPPAQLRPMLAVPGTLPARDDGWAYEIKWDGVRAIVYVDGGRVRLFSRNDNELTQSFPELHEIGEILGSRPAVLDGEIVVMGEDGKPNFGRLQRRLHSSASVARTLVSEHPATFVVFDVVYVDGRDLLNASYDERRTVLESLQLTGPSLTTAASFHDVKGADILRATAENGLEGIIAKRRDAPYLPGVRSDRWVKVKNVRTQEVVIGGWTEGSGARASTLGALLLGIPDEGGLRFVGKVGTGFSEREGRELVALLQRAARKTNPFTADSWVKEAAPHFVRPSHVGEVQFGEWTSSGRLRHPTWRGLRPDKDPKDVILET